MNNVIVEERPLAEKERPLALAEDERLLELKKAHQTRAKRLRAEQLRAFAMLLELHGRADEFGSFGDSTDEAVTVIVEALEALASLRSEDVDAYLVVPVDTALSVLVTDDGVFAVAKHGGGLPLSIRVCHHADIYGKKILYFGARERDVPWRVLVGAIVDAASADIASVLRKQAEQTVAGRL